ncbi:hypothetical protein L1987_47034 [Smallanthus sonchifolius]|uniref:Uncharacterized protein n=1 Tax=Smallanthus sonchifolius TaxID=185202 RepID=A0ACB9G2I0_9ASTR|nr:hypothetical protein L1987_47034 [Smallanthus sonchifolius]
MVTTTLMLVTIDELTISKQLHPYFASSRSKSLFLFENQENPNILRERERERWEEESTGKLSEFSSTSLIRSLTRLKMVALTGSGLYLLVLCPYKSHFQRKLSDEV